MNVETAQKIVDRLIGQPVHEEHGEAREYYRPHNCNGPPVKLIVAGIAGQNGEVCCEVKGWSCSVVRQANRVVLPPGLTHAKVAEAIGVLETEISHLLGRLGRKQEYV